MEITELGRQIGDAVTRQDKGLRTDLESSVNE